MTVRVLMVILLVGGGVGLSPCEAVSPSLLTPDITRRGGYTGAGIEI